MAKLELRWWDPLGKRAQRLRNRRSIGSTYEFVSGEWLDFVVDGVSMHDTLSISDNHNVGVLGWIPPESEDAHVRRLLLDEPSHLETGRIELYVCRVCADIGCGAVTCLVEARNDRIVWRDFGKELNYHLDDKEPLVYEPYESIAPIEFDGAQYREALLDRPPRE